MINPKGKGIIHVSIRLSKGLILKIEIAMLERIGVFVSLRGKNDQKKVEKLINQVETLNVTDCYLVLNSIKAKTLKWFVGIDRVIEITNLLKSRGISVHFLVFPRKEHLKGLAEKIIPLGNQLRIRSILFDLEGNWVLRSSQREKYADIFFDLFLSEKVNTNIGVYGYGYIQGKVKPFARMADYVAPDAQYPGFTPRKAHRIWRKYNAWYHVMVLPAHKTSPSKMASYIREINTLTNPQVTEIAYWSLKSLFYRGKLNTKGRYVKRLADGIYQRSSELSLHAEYTF